jgi:predicted Na+-dependent transporter
LLALPLYLGYLSGWLLRLSWNDTFAICIEVLTRNAHLGVLLKASLFPSDSATDNALGDGVLFVVLFAGFAALVIGGMEAFGKRRYWGVYASLRPPA